tara:strand:- start:762 stop:1019 length:258 start_codon:yes stop_codon:yes gene_type:complete
MSQANLDRFLQEARTNTALSDRLREVRSHEELIKLASDHGHALSKPTVMRHHLHRLAGMSDAELDNLGHNVFDRSFSDVFIGSII